MNQIKRATAAIAALLTTVGATCADLTVLYTNGEYVSSPVQLGTFNPGEGTTCHFILTNSGSESLELTNVAPMTLSGRQTAGFALSGISTTHLAAGETASFSLSFTALAPNAHTAVVALTAFEPATTSTLSTAFSATGSGYYSNLLTETAFDLPGIGNGTACWGDYNNDGFPDLLLSGRTATGLFTAIYRNHNGTSLSNISAQLPAAEVSRADWGDYDNDGDLDLAFCGYMTNGQNTAAIYRNDGSDTFTPIDAPLAPVYGGAIRWGDSNNDGLLDLALAGFCDVSSNVTFLYINQDNDTFIDSNISFTGVRDGSLDWIDYDNDGLRDLAISGDTTGGKITRIYRNNGTTFTNIAAAIPGCALGKACWTDLDVDGDTDLSLCGYGSSAPFARLYRNVGGSVPFLRIDTNQVAAAWLGTSAWGDYDSDGDPDLLSGGISTNGTLITHLYNNDGYGNLEDTGLPLPPLKQTIAAWVDINADSHLDLFLSGRNTNGAYTTKIYLNSAPFSNSPPSTPSNLTATVTNGSSLVLTWDEAADYQTPARALTYALYLGTASNTPNLINPMADLSTGQRRIIRPINNSTRKSFTVPWFSPTGTCHWGVQAIDASGAGSPFAHGTPVTRDWLPDFTVTRIAYLPSPFTVYVTISNASPTAGDAGTLALWLDQPAEVTNSASADRTTTIGVLDAGESRTINFTNFVPADAIVTNILCAFINAENITLEESLTNNQLTLEYTTIVYDTFQLSAFGLQQSNTIRWTDPIECGLQTRLVHLRWSTNTFPAGLTDGLPLYEGTNRVYHHTDLTPGRPCYYSIWVSNDGTNFITPPAPP